MYEDEMYEEPCHEEYEPADDLYDNEACEDDGQPTDLDEHRDFAQDDGFDYHEHDDPFSYED